MSAWTLFNPLKKETFPPKSGHYLIKINDDSNVFAFVAICLILDEKEVEWLPVDRNIVMSEFDLKKLYWTHIPD